ncbi:MAG: bifunctional UDP-N-acetylglucosamine diphosphorylase/glucosamine-1-phosphate N-acetyltransferase GlmU [Acidobacteriota bacterium]
MDNLTVVILAAGLGTRMKSKKAKVLHEAGGMPLVEHVVAAASELAPPGRIFVVVGHQAERVEAALAARGVGFVLQAQQAGTGHALRECRNRIAPLGGDVMVLYGDCPLLSPATLRRLVEVQRGENTAAAVITTVLDDPTGYGRILRGPDGAVRAIVEQKAGTPEELAVREINSGIYCFRGDLLWKYLAEITPNPASGEVYLTDMVELLRKAGYATVPLLLEDPTEVLGINSRADLAVVDAVFRRRKTMQLMLSGVTIEKPETVTIDSGVQIGIDTVVEPFARILGKTTIGEDCRIGACSIVRDSELGDEVEVRPFSMIDASRIERGVVAGPYARLRMNAVVKAGAQVGNFVEVKNSQVGPGAKAMHLAYLGDSTVGAKVNIGAGTITCNYDGVRKNHTEIGEGAFVGSNSTLVAPVEIGANAYVGAGSVVTEPVPAESLALGRARQTVKEGWVRKRLTTPK